MVCAAPYAAPARRAPAVECFGVLPSLGVVGSIKCVRLLPPVAPSVISRLLLSSLLATSLALAAGGVRAQAAPPAIAVATPNYVKPEYAGKLASPQKDNAFKKEYTAYDEWMKKYTAEIKLILNAAATAVNGAVEEFNKFAADIEAQDEAAKN
jgi:hypothetical protein